MRKKMLSRPGLLLLGLFLVIGYFVLLPLAPRSVRSDIYAVKWYAGNEKLYHLRGDQMQCEPADSPLTVRCSTLLEGQPFAVDVQYHDARRTSAEACQAQYGGIPVACEPGRDYANPAPSLIIRDQLGITPERFATLRGQEPLLYWSELVWIGIARGLAIIIALVAIVWHWLQYVPQTTASPREQQLLASLLAGIATWWMLLWGLGTIVSSYPDAPGWLQSSYIAWGGAVLAFFWRWHIMEQRRPPAGIVKVIHSAWSGGVLFAVTHSALLIGLLSLGFID